MTPAQPRRFPYNPRMKRLIFALGCTLAVWTSVAAQSQPATSEPHHKRLLYTNDVRVFDVVVPPGQSTSDYAYAHGVATVVIGSGVTSVRDAGSVIHVDNSATADYHAIEVENMRDDDRFLMPPVIMAAGTSVLTQSRAFTVYDVKLAADQTTRHEHAWSTIAVLLSGAIEQGGIGGEEPARLRGAGQWLTLPRAQAHTLTAIGGDAHVVEIEAR